jgi:anti-sigma factor ChrR (cupin superfamily)
MLLPTSSSVAHHNTAAVGNSASDVANDDDDDDGTAMHSHQQSELDDTLALFRQAQMQQALSAPTVSPSSDGQSFNPSAVSGRRGLEGYHTAQLHAPPNERLGEMI